MKPVLVLANCLLAIVFTANFKTVIAQAIDETAKTESSDADIDHSVDQILQGHSQHGEAFNEGPRQAAYLMGGTGNVNFPATTDSEQAQAFINQGVGQLHGFWYLEAERSFRQAAAIDPDCAIAYWGAAQAANTNRKRAQGFMEKAVALKDKVTEREKLYIDSADDYFQGETDVKKIDEDDKKRKANAYLKALESIVLKYPDDLEAKAFVAHRIWHNGREGVPIGSYLATDALINEIFEKEPLHPSHHYTIHLWDYRHPEKAVASAARCGPAAPSIAHMWHMPGHIYSRLKRYEDAVYQQEASARVDHAHMMRDGVIPDEIMNFAHNNEWLIRNLVYIGRVSDALDLAKNMCGLPRHPRYNTLDKNGGSASYGRRRLLQVLREYQLYEQAIDLCQTGEKIAQILDENQARLEELTPLKRRLTVAKSASEKKGEDHPPTPMPADVNLKTLDKDLAKTKKDHAKAKRLVSQCEKAILAIEGYRLVADMEYGAARQKLLKAAGEDVSWLGELHFLAGEYQEGTKTVKKQIERRPSESIPLARFAFLQYQNYLIHGKKESGDEADVADLKDVLDAFEELKNCSSSLDLSAPIFSRLEPVAELLQQEDDWRSPPDIATDIGERPELDTLGPFRWSPSPAPSWNLADSNDSEISSSEFAGHPHIIIFYLGHGCLHCAEQLQKFGPHVAEFEAAGIEMVAISSDEKAGLAKSIENYEGEMPFKNLVSDQELEVFKKFRAYDDFEDQPLHGTFLVDGRGIIRWQDISYEPFMDHEFLLKEAKRLLEQNDRDREVVGQVSKQRLE